MLRTTKLAVLAAAAALSLTACSSSPEDAGGSGGGASDELRYGAVVDVATWSAADAFCGNTALYCSAVYDTLLRTAADGTVEPGLAEAWEHDEPRTHLTLDLRDGVTFTDGTELTAEVAAQNLERFRNGASEKRAPLGRRP
ncbi:ABC transporter substrate-binding protein [Kineococcus auxinigenes]|uniref:ABC transporter substrate-binding protein n=1 Tax=unclassified Kineococcus TaxID=2621656 RepID=UPI003D7ED2D1